MTTEHRSRLLQEDQRYPWPHHRRPRAGGCGGADRQGVARIGSHCPFRRRGVCRAAAETGLDRALQIAERILKAVRASGAHGLPPYTVSIGVACQSSPDEKLDGLLLRADQALYRAKSGGRDRIEIAAPLVTSGIAPVMPPIAPVMAPASVVASNG
jgi:hypothetical protein